MTGLSPRAARRATDTPPGTPTDVLPQVVDTGVAGLRLQTTFPARHLCPYKDERDVGYIEITWTTGTHTLELHSVRGYLDGWEHVKVSHEDYTGDIAAELAELDGITVESVTSRWTTAGAHVAVTATPAAP